MAPWLRIRSMMSCSSYLFRECMAEHSRRRLRGFLPGATSGQLEVQHGWCQKATETKPAPRVTSGTFVNSFRWPGDSAAIERTLWESLRGIDAGPRSPALPRVPREIRAKRCP